MKVLVGLLLALVALVHSRSIDIENVVDYEIFTSYNYHERNGIPLAKEIQEWEARPESRVHGGSQSNLGQFPHQAGLLIDTPSGLSVCGGSILAVRRVITAAHCWFDGRTQASRFTVILGSIRLQSGGQRLQTTNVAMHASWNWNNFQNDIAMITVNSNINFNNNVAAIALPSGNELNENFVGSSVIVSGFGRTGDRNPQDNISSNQPLHHATLSVISNSDCTRLLNVPGFSVHSSHICARGSNRQSTCGGDSGGPMTVNRSGRPILIGITNFGREVCAQGFPAAFARVTSFNTWIRSRI